MSEQIKAILNDLSSHIATLIDANKALASRLTILEAQVVHTMDATMSLQQELAETKLDLGGHIHAS